MPLSVPLYYGTIAPSLSLKLHLHTPTFIKKIWFETPTFFFKLEVFNKLMEHFEKVNKYNNVQWLECDNHVFL